MRMKARVLFALGIAVACFATVTPAAMAQGTPPGINPTHYWTYQLGGAFSNPQPIAVQDQFLTNYVPNTTDHLERLVNWVEKTDPTGVVSAVPDTFLHYTWWNLQGKYQVNKFVQVTNQFGSYPVNVYNLEFLLAPAYKNYQDPVHPFPVANHYLCYRANGFPSPNMPYGLQDEWRQDVQIPGPMEFLCVPCWKQHNGIVYPPVETETHLALYPIQPSSEFFVPYLTDQFFRGPQDVHQKPTEYLLVPSTKKEIITDTKPSSWGKIKLLYR